MQTISSDVEIENVIECERGKARHQSEKIEKEQISTWITSPQIGQHTTICMRGECFYQIMGLSFSVRSGIATLNDLHTDTDTHTHTDTHSPTHSLTQFKGVWFITDPKSGYKFKIRWNNDKCQETIDHIVRQIDKCPNIECGYRYDFWPPKQMWFH